MEVKKQIKVKPDQAGRADRVVQTLTELSRAEVRGLFDHNCVRVNGKLVSRAGETVKPGDVVEVKYDIHRRYRERPQPRSKGFRLIYEDDYLLVVDKAAGILSVPTTKQEQNTLVHELARYVSKGPRIRRRISIVHRLERETSGLLVFAKTPSIADRLKHQFALRKPEREYVAIVYGRLAQDEGTFRSQHSASRGPGARADSASETGTMAVTHYTVSKRLKNATVVKVKLETGRRNQIRVHFAEQGHPVLGDERYRPELALQPDWEKKRLALHASVLGFKHPVTNQSLRFVAPPPAVFNRYAKGQK